MDPRVRAVRSIGTRDADAAAIGSALEGEAEVVIDALGPTPSPDLTKAGFDSVRTDGTMVLLLLLLLLGGVRQSLPIPYDQLMRRRITLRGSWMCSEETASRVWRQVQTGIVDLSALEVTIVGIDDPTSALEQAKQTRGLPILTP